MKNSAIENLSEFIKIIYPEFVVRYDENDNELVFLDNGSIESGVYKISDKTQCEAFVNHFHLFDKFPESEFEKVFAIGDKIAKNLIRRLDECYPDKKFVVYLEINRKDSTIIRFHQLWENEPPYFDMAFKYPDTEIFEYKNQYKTED